MPTQFEVGYLIGILVGEGHFGGDGRNAQVTLRMHVRHEAIFRWLERTFPGGRLYGPYNHDGRRYFQWMARGTFLRDELIPMLDRHLSPELDRHSYDRLQLMKTRYLQKEGKRASWERPIEPGVASADDRAASPRSVPAPSAEGHCGAAPRPGPEGSVEPDSFAEIFSQLREVWPASQAQESESR
jgi:hypothetical protein